MKSNFYLHLLPPLSPLYILLSLRYLIFYVKLVKEKRLSDRAVANVKLPLL